jgi:predicted ATPase
VGKLFELEAPASPGLLLPANLRGRLPADLADAPVAADADVRAVIGLLAESMSPAYTAAPALLPLITVKALNLSLRFGNVEESAPTYSGYAIMLVSMYAEIPLAFQFSEATLRLNERFNDSALKGKLLLHHGALISLWCRHFAQSIPLVEQAFLACLDVGDLVVAGFVAYNSVWLLVENGSPLDHVLEVSRKYVAFARQSHNDVVYNVVRAEEQFAASLKGDTRAPASFDDSAFNEAECVAALNKADFGLGIAYYHVLKQISAVTYERYPEALEHAAEAARVLREVMAMATEATHHFYHALTLTALYPQAPPERQQGYLRALEGLLRKHKLWADNCPENFLNRYALVVADDGVGLPADFDLGRGQSLGMQLVGDLAQQLGGTVALRREGGTTFTITFRSDHGRA